MHTSKTRNTALPTAASILLLMATPALAQYELGTGSQLNAEMSTRRNPDGTFNKAATGNALDANTQLYSNGFNFSTPGYATVAGGGNYDFAARNDVLTRNVVAGRGFQGSVGYRAQYDFRGNLGTNDLFRFRADSALSNPAYASLGSTFQSLRFGQDLAMIDMQRSGTGASPSRLRQDDSAYLAEVRADRETMVNLSSLTAQNIADTRIIGTTYNQEGQPFVVSTSPVRGITVEPPSGAAALAGLSLYDAARLRQDAVAGLGKKSIGEPFQTRFELDEDISGRIEGDPTAKPIRPETPKEYEEILERVAERYATSENVEFDQQPELQKKLNEKYQRLRKQLTGELPPTDETAETDESRQPRQDRERDDDNRRLMPGLDSEGNLLPPTDQRPELPGSTDRPGVGDLSDTSDLFPAVTGPLNKGSKDPNAVDLDEFAVALRHNQHMEQLSPQDQSRFAELMTTAEQWLREGQYFLAERRFERALRFIPGHPLATVGIAHSQVGSGLYLSAAATLRTLLARQPELIDVTYGPNVLPDRERLLENVATIKQRLQGVRDLESYAFLLAYLGHQLDDRALIEQGLDTLDSLAPDDALAQLLRKIWLEGETVKAPAPAAEPNK